MVAMSIIGFEPPAQAMFGERPRWRFDRDAYAPSRTPSLDRGNGLFPNTVHYANLESAFAVDGFSR